MKRFLMVLTPSLASLGIGAVAVSHPGLTRTSQVQPAGPVAAGKPSTPRWQASPGAPETSHERKRTNRK